jgi:hypothetical protein
LPPGSLLREPARTTLVNSFVPTGDIFKPVKHTLYKVAYFTHALKEPSWQENYENQDTECRSTDKSRSICYWLYDNRITLNDISKYVF